MKRDDYAFIIWEPEYGICQALGKGRVAKPVRGGVC